MSVTVDPIDITVEPVVVSAGAASPIDVDVNSPDPLTVDVSAAALAATVTGAGLAVTVAVQGSPGVPGGGGTQQLHVGGTEPPAASVPQLWLAEIAPDEYAPKLIEET